MRRAAGVALAGLLLAACGGAGGGAKALEETESKLSDIRSGTLSLLLLASSTTAAEGDGAGFNVEGPFAVGEKKGALPVADLTHTRITGSQRRTTRFVSTGSRAFVEVDGRLTELNGSQVAGLRVQEEGSAGGLDGLSLRRWLDGAELAPGPTVDREALGELAGARLTLALEVKDLNRPVEVTVPQPQGGRR